jgi:hypothetical protein
LSSRTGKYRPAGKCILLAESPIEKSSAKVIAMAGGIEVVGWIDEQPVSRKKPTNVIMW